MRVYIAGPMTGLPQFNIPAFQAAADDLRGRGYDVVSPVELDAPETRAAGMASADGDPVGYYGTIKDTWGGLLARDVQLIADDGIEAVFVLPGWERSRGARLETFVAGLGGLPILHYPDEVPVPTSQLASAWGQVAVDLNPVRTRRTGPDPEDREPVRERGFPNGVGTGHVRVDSANPKDAIGTRKAPLRLVPPALAIEVAPAMANGAAKYGAYNWREKDVRSSIYGEAILRHLYAWMDGEDVAADSGVKHLGHLAACVAILLDADANGNLIDDRPTRGPATALLAAQDASGS